MFYPFFQKLAKSYSGSLPETRPQGGITQPLNFDTITSPLGRTYDAPGVVLSCARVSCTVGENFGGGPIAQLPLFGHSVLGNAGPGASVHAGLRR